MKMPLFQNDRTRRRRNVLLPSSIWFVTGALFILVILVALVSWLAPGFLPTIATPFWQAGEALSNGTRSVSSVFGNASELTAERDRLIAENSALTEVNRTLAAKETDLERLIGESGTPEHRILAGVLARPPVSPYDTLVVAQGSKAGVRVGAFAYGPGGVPLGTVAGVTNDTAHIELFSTGGKVTEGWVGEKRIPLTLTGRGAGAFVATLPRASGVLVNDVVYVPGPGALPIGTVVRIDTNPSAPRDTVHIAPYANVFSLTWIEIAP